MVIRQYFQTLRGKRVNQNLSQQLLLPDLREGSEANANQISESTTTPGSNLASESNKRAQEVRALFLVLGITATVYLTLSFFQSRFTYFATILVFFIGVLLNRKNEKKEAAKALRDLEISLPMTLEKLLMCIESGLDIYPAIEKLVTYENLRRQKEDHKTPKLEINIILENVVKMVQSGIALENAFENVAGRYNSPILKHAFIHLTLSHKEGGEIAKPLRELSDATNQYVKDAILEDIAKLPAKATIPMLLTFMGLLVCFLATPLISILLMIQKFQTN